MIEDKNSIGSQKEQWGKDFGFEVSGATTGRLLTGYLRNYISQDC
jgi:hypothetical protein